MQLLAWKPQFSEAREVRASRIQVYALVKDGLIDPSAWQAGCGQSWR